MRVRSGTANDHLQHTPSRPPQENNIVVYRVCLNLTIPSIRGLHSEQSTLLKYSLENRTHTTMSIACLVSVQV